MKIKSRLPYFTSKVTGNNIVSPENTNLTCSSSLQSHTSLQTLPSVPSLQSDLLPVTDTVIVTYSLSSSITLPSPITSLSLAPTSPSVKKAPTQIDVSHASHDHSLLYASSGHQINVYDSTTWAHIDTLNAASLSTGAVKSIAFSDNKVLTAHQDGKIRVWKLNETENETVKHKLVSTLPTKLDRLMSFPLPKNHVQVRRHKTRLWLEHNDAVSGIKVANLRIYSVSWDKTMKVWDPKDLRCKESVTVSEDAVNALAVSEDGVAYTGSAEGRIKVWSTKTRDGSEKKHELVATLEKHKSAVNALALNNDGSILFSGACDRSILVWEREDSGKYMSVIGALRGHEGAILCLINVSDFLISGSADRTVRIWRHGGDSKFCCLAVLTGHNKAVKCLTGKMEGEDGISVFSGGLDGEIKVWSVKIDRS